MRKDESSAFPRLLLRPFIDLEPCATGPLYARGIELYWQAFADPHRPRFALQRTLPHAFRKQFLAEVGLFDHQVNDPRDLSPALTSERWTVMSESLNCWPGLAPEQQLRLSMLLNALGFYQVIAHHVPNKSITEIRDTLGAELAYSGASARYVLGLPDRVADYHDANMSEFEIIASLSLRDTPVSFNAAIKVFVHQSKVGAPATELSERRDRLEQTLLSAITPTDEFMSQLLWSRFYRAVAFVPQRHGDRAETVRIMDLAEHHALALAPRDEAQQLIYLENLHPLMESRTKEALWIGDRELALARAQRVIELDPYDSKAWLELGDVELARNDHARAAEAYSTAAILGPPANALGRHMAGLCFRDLGQPQLAAFFFKSAIETDSRAISPHDQIQSLPDLPVLAALKEWSLRSFEA